MQRLPKNKLIFIIFFKNIQQKVVIKISKYNKRFVDDVFWKYNKIDFNTYKNFILKLKNTEIYQLDIDLDPRNLKDVHVKRFFAKTKYDYELRKIKDNFNNHPRHQFPLNEAYIYYEIFDYILKKDFRYLNSKQIKKFLDEKYNNMRGNKDWDSYFRRNIVETMITICFEDIEIYRYLLNYSYLLSLLKPLCGSGDGGISIFRVLLNRNKFLALKFADWVMDNSEYIYNSYFPFGGYDRQKGYSYAFELNDYTQEELENIENLLVNLNND